MDGELHWLIGRWRLQRCERGLELQPRTAMQFHADGQLTYLIPQEPRELRFSLEYRIEGNLLCTDHPAGGHAQAVRFQRLEDGLLEFDFNGRRAWFRREPRA